MAYTPEQQQWIIAEANRRAIKNGTSVAAEIAAEAQKSGMDMATAERNMGYSAGTLGGAPQTATMGANTSNLGFNGADYSPVPAPAATPAAASVAGGGVTQPVTQNVRSTDNRWQGDPSRNPDGSMNPYAGGGYGGGGNLGMGDTAYQRNPYLDAASRDIGGQMFDQWKRNVAPGIRSNAMATGGYGGSRQGVVEANSMNDLGRNYSSALTNMYGQDYTNFQNRGIQRQGQAQSYDLGLRSNDLGFAGLDANIAQNNFGNQLQAANFGMGVQDYLNRNNATGVAAGTQINNTPWDYQKYLNTAGNQAGSGWNSNTTTKTGG